MDIGATLRTLGLDHMKAEVGKKFYKMDYVIEALYIAFTTGKNIILYGPGGYGKSQIVKEFIKVASIPSSTIVGYEDMEVEALLGLPNMKKLTEDSEYEIAFEKSKFMNPGVLILEEFMDVRPATAAALKDILSEKGYRRGAEFIPSAVESVVICTNKAPEEVSSNLSLGALYKERFPIAVKVVWEEHDYNAYAGFIKHHIGLKTFKDSYYILAELCARTSANEANISPRKVIDALDILKQHDDIKLLKLIPDIDTTTIEEVERTQHLRKEKVLVESTCAKIEMHLSSLRVRESSTVSYIINSIAELSYISEKLQTISVDYPDNVEIILKTLNNCNSMKEALSNKIDASVHDISKAELDKMFLI